MPDDSEEEMRPFVRPDLRVRLKRLLRVREEVLEEGLPIPPELESQIRKVREALGMDEP
ncbi:MAG: hypothetical protein K8U57_31340 [Planctomycetes bacterium]|nr:hypothetical protein [Planctomycetota bacterium]